ncbi:biotin-dependent carboxyltransferase family protein [Mycolicibacterium sp. F2034L]|uniref:5-oxoprolinase subunit C family protein n=1 Tax=Mycolicibacterium sp. F2034L TaxID=2926422 RepID=UPI001FF12446|nr:biotin-dependent carboxyltransferase family protein [Mycolicibacterium sp. F2034L]MCK0173865.1 biotin-dependent carboxyltransferase family protein [Mycolicibacterium sp. F2034L]
MSRVTIEAVGMLALLQDAGRHGLAHFGVGQSGAADRTSFDLANRLVGNLPGTACIEVTLGRMSFSVDAPALIALTGAPVAVMCGGRAHGMNAAFVVPAGHRVTLGAPTAGLRTYVAIRGGLVGQNVLGSMSWDTMAQLGTPPLRAGDVVAVGSSTTDWPAIDFAPVAAPDPDETLVLPIQLGPRDDWFCDTALDRLASAEFTVTSDTDRVGIRLGGPELPRRRRGELGSEGVVLGALQVPTRGRPTLFLTDRPVTGGYPVIGVVTESAVYRAAQAPPGARIRFAVAGRRPIWQ